METSKVEASEVGEMMTEVSKVITSHLYKLVNKFEEDKKNMVSTVEILKKLPIIKELEDKLKKAEEENAKLRSKIKELLARSSQSKKITLQTEEINESEKPVSYSEIDALVETQVKNKENATKDEPNYNYSTYLANQSDTDTSDNESDASEIDTSEMHHVYDSSTLLGSWNTREDSTKNKSSYDPKVLELAKSNYAKYYNKEKKDVTIKEIEDSSAGIEGWGESMVIEAVEEELGPAELAKEAAQNEEDGDEEQVDTDEEIVAVESDDEIEEKQVEDDEAEYDDEAEEDEAEEDEAEEDDEVEEEEDDEAEEDEAEEDEAEEDEAEEDDEVEEEEDDEAEEDEAEEEDDEVEEGEEEDEVADDDEAEEDEAADDDEELEVEEIKIEGKMYYCTGKENGLLFEYCEDGEIGDEIGHLEDSAVFFS